MRAGAILGLLLLFSPPALAEAPPPPDPHGAVLCAWHIYLRVKDIGESCLSDEQSDFKQLLAQSVEKIEAFIMANGPASQKEIDEARARIRADTAMFQHRLGYEVCRPAERDLYRHVEAQGLSAMRDYITKLLAVPRKPVMNPCL
jgi:hypothetical protein